MKQRLVSASRMAKGPAALEDIIYFQL